MFSKNAKRWLIFVFIILTTATAHAVDPNRKFYQYEFGGPGPNDDLPEQIYDIQEDRQGFLWMATSRGLARYDGLETTFFSVSKYPEVQSNSPTGLFIDSSNQLFVACERGVSLFDGTSFRALPFASESTPQIHTFEEDANGKVWLGSEEGLWYFDGEQIVPFTNSHALAEVRALHSHGEQLFIGGRGYINVLTGSDITLIELPLHYVKEHVRDIEFHQGKIWAATRLGLFVLDGNVATEIQRQELEGAEIDVLMSDRNENLWFGGHNTMGRFFPDGTIELPEVVSDGFGYMPEITALFEDSLGQHWHTSSFFGLVFMRDTPIRRLSYSEGLDSTTVTALAHDGDGRTLVATDQGISVLSENTIDVLVKEDLSQSNTVRSMSATPDGLLWVGTETEIRLFDMNERKWRSFDGDGELGTAVNSVANGINNSLWAGTDDGLYKIEDGRLDRVDGVGELAIESLLVDSDGVLWIGSSQGISTLVDGNVRWQASEIRQSVDKIEAMVELPSGDIVAATSDRGILVQVGDRWLRYTEENGLPAERLIDLEVRGGTLWIITGAGIYSAEVSELTDPETASLETNAIAVRYGIRAAHTTNCCYGENQFGAILLNGRFFAATDDGVVIFDDDTATAGQAPPRPYIKAIDHDGVNRRPDQVASLQLEADHPGLRIDYSAIQTARGDQVRFRHRLRGYSDEWVFAGRSRSAQFQNLPPGDFEFEVQASLQPDIWSSHTASLSFSKHPALTDTAQFKLATWAAMILVALLVISMQLRWTRHRRRHIELQILQRTEELHDLNERLKSSNKDLERSTRTDPLTGLVNRRFFDDSIMKSRLADRVADHGLLVMIDFDFFKRVNDSYGHLAGDEVLRQIAAVLQESTQRDDLVARWGGEEFVVICSGSNAQYPSEILEQLCKTVREHSFELVSGQQVKLTCSIGGVRYPLENDHAFDDHFPTLLDYADAALYAVKMFGRDGWALLERGEGQHDNLAEIESNSGYMGVRLLDAIESGYLDWKASRAEISLSMSDTVTRLRALDVER